MFILITDICVLASMYDKVNKHVLNGLNVPEWRRASHLFNDPSLPDMLAFGFPSGHLGSVVPATNLANHASAVRNPAHISKFLNKEINLGAMVGPFNEAPFKQWFRNNPLMTRPKRNSDELRVILDLSFPLGNGVNSGIAKEQLDGAPFKLRLPSPLDLGRLMLSLGKGCKLYKIDLSRAYCQLRSDPLDWPLQGISWEGQHYVDVAIPFGLRHGASACQRTSEAAGQVSAARYGSKMFAYVDDTAGGAVKEKAEAHYKGLLVTMDTLGLEVALAKCQAPSYIMLRVGVHFNSLTMTMSIDPDRVSEAIQQCKEFLALTKVTLHQLQKLLGKLFHAMKCTESARVFLSRFLDLLALAGRQQVVQVSEDARADARWCVTFLERFNGITLAKPQTAEFTAFVDSCLLGGGGVCQGFGYYSTVYPGHITGGGLSISALECFNLLLAVRLWVREWAGHHVLIFCDNAATVGAMNSGRAQESLMRGALRECWWLTALWDVQLTVRHRPGALMEEADLMSRAGTSKAFEAKFAKYVSSSPEARVYVLKEHLLPPISI